MFITVFLFCSFVCFVLFCFCIFCLSEYLLYCLFVSFFFCSLSISLSCGTANSKLGKIST